MPRVTDAQVLARREQVLDLWTRGASMTKIAHALRADRETIRRDVTMLARQAVAEVDVPRELARCLLSARAVELDRWQKGQPLQALGAIKVQVAVLQAMLGLDTAERVAALERRLDELAVGTSGVIHPEVAHVNGHAGGSTFSPVKK